MNEAPDSSAADRPPVSPGMAFDTAIETRGEFKAAIASAIRCALEERERAMWWLAPSFENWPLDDPEVLATLTRWALLPGRRLTILCADFEALAKAHPGFVRGRRDLVHAIVGRRPVDQDAMPDEALLLTGGGIVVRLPDASRPRGTCRRWGADATQARARVDAVLQRSEEAFATTVLGI